MPAIIIRDGESFESALRRFKKLCERSGILSDIKKREFYEKPSVKRKKKILAAKKRALKNRGRPQEVTQGKRCYPHLHLEDASWSPKV